MYALNYLDHELWESMIFPRWKNIKGIITKALCVAFLGSDALSVRTSLAPPLSPDFEQQQLFAQPDEKVSTRYYYGGPY